MKKRACIISLFVLMLSACSTNPGLPANWRPFSDNSPWNTPVASDASVHPSSAAIITNMNHAASNIRFGNSYLSPLWVVAYDGLDLYPVQSTYPFDIWDNNNDCLVDIFIPLTKEMWGEQTPDGHIIIIDTLYKLSWEMSRYKGIVNDTARCSTFNVWDLSGSGTGNPNEGARWNQRGGRGSGFPIIAGLIRPEEIKAGEIHHALTFTFDRVKQDDIYHPGCRSDGFVSDADAPAEGMLFQLNPKLTDRDFISWGLSEGAIVVARALQVYGMYLCDSGGDMALQLQLLDKDADEHRKRWDKVSPGLYKTIIKIPTDEFRLIDTGKPVSGGGQGVVTTPLIEPLCGSYEGFVTVRMKVNNHWPDAVIRYTIDGSRPGLTSTIYSGPLTIESSATIHAQAFSPDGEESPVTRSAIIIY